MNFNEFYSAPDAADVLPKLTPLKDQIVSEGQPAQFKTQVTPSKPKPTIQWYREGALIPQSPDFQVKQTHLYYQPLKMVPGHSGINSMYRN